MTKRLTIGILALVIGSAILLSSCGDESEKSSDSESSEALSSDIQTPEDTSEVVEQSESISEDISPDISDDISEAVSEPISEDVSADISDIIVVPDGFKGHLMGDALALMDFEKGFGVSFSTTTSFGEVGVEAYAKGDLMYAETRLMSWKTTLIAKGGEAYKIDVKGKKYQTFEESVADIFEIFDTSELIDSFLIYVDTVEETVDGVTYVVERYKEADKTEISFKGYFKDDKLQMLCDSNGVLAKMSITDDIPEDILSFPEGYSELMPGDYIAVPEEYKDTPIGKILSKYNGEDGFVVSIYEKDIDDDGQVLDSTKQTISIKDDKVRSDSECVSSSSDVIHTEIYLDGFKYELNHEEKSYTKEERHWFSLGEGLFDGLEYFKTGIETIDGVAYTVDVFYISLGGNTTYEEEYEVRFYSLDGEWRYMKAEGELIGIEISAFKDTDEIFEIPDGYTLEED